MGKAVKEVSNTGASVRKYIPSEIRKIVPKELPLPGISNFTFPTIPGAPSGESGGAQGLPTAPPMLPPITFSLPSTNLGDISQSGPGTVGRMDVLGVRSRKGGQRGTLRNQRGLTATQMSSIAAAAGRAGLNLPV
jgi:hypothetical protein